MYIYQDGKLYSLIGEKQCVGVEIYTDKVLKIDGTETDVLPTARHLTKQEVVRKFHIEDEPYIFPVECEKVKVEEEVKPTEEVVEDEPTDKIKRTYTKRK